MSDASGGPQMVTVKCEKHGLRYNPNLHSGCVRCRKEAGEPIAGAPAGGRAAAVGAAAAGAAAAAGGSVIPALAVAALLVVATGSGFYFAHRQWYDSIGNEELGFPDDLELTPEQREHLERLRDEMEKQTPQGPGR